MNMTAERIDLDPLVEMVRETAKLTNIESIKIFRSSGSNHWYYSLPTGEYESFPGRILSDMLTICGIRLPDDAEQRAEVVAHYGREVLTHNNVHYAGGLAGCKPGPVSTNDGRKILVTRDSGWMPPVEGDIDELMEFFKGLFPGPAHDVVLGWLKYFVKDLQKCREFGPWKAGLLPSQALIIVGPPGVGKTLFASMVRELVGGKHADPYMNFCRETRFNNELLSCLWTTAQNR